MSQKTVVDQGFFLLISSADQKQGQKALLPDFDCNMNIFLSNPAAEVR